MRDRLALTMAILTKNLGSNLISALRVRAVRPPKVSQHPPSSGGGTLTGLLVLLGVFRVQVLPPSEICTITSSLVSDEESRCVLTQSPSNRSGTRVRASTDHEEGAQAVDVRHRGAHPAGHGPSEQGLPDVWKDYATLAPPSSPARPMTTLRPA